MLKRPIRYYTSLRTLSDPVEYFASFRTLSRSIECCNGLRISHHAVDLVSIRIVKADRIVELTLGSEDGRPKYS